MKSYLTEAKKIPLYLVVSKVMWDMNWYNRFLVAKKNNKIQQHSAVSVKRVHRV